MYKVQIFAGTNIAGIYFSDLCCYRRWPTFVEHSCLSLELIHQETNDLKGRFNALNVLQNSKITAVWCLLFDSALAAHLHVLSDVTSLHRTNDVYALMSHKAY